MRAASLDQPKEQWPGVLALEGNRASALQMGHAAVARAGRVSAPSGLPTEFAVRHCAEAYRQLGTVYATFGEWNEARAAAERAVSCWRKLANAGSKMVVPAELDRAEHLLQEAATHLL